MSKLRSRLLLLCTLLPPCPPLPPGPSSGHEQLLPLLCTTLLLLLLPACDVLQMLMPLHRLLPLWEGGSRPQPGCACCSHVPTAASSSDALPAWGTSVVQLRALLTGWAAVQSPPLCVSETIGMGAR